MSFETQCQDSGKSLGNSPAARAAPLEIPSVGVAECMELGGAAFIFISLSQLWSGCGCCGGVVVVVAAQALSSCQEFRQPGGDSVMRKNHPALICRLSQ